MKVQLTAAAIGGFVGGILGSWIVLEQEALRPVLRLWPVLVPVVLIVFGQLLRWQNRQADDA